MTNEAFNISYCQIDSSPRFAGTETLSPGRARSGNYWQTLEALAYTNRDGNAATKPMFLLPSTTFPRLASVPWVKATEELSPSLDNVYCALIGARASSMDQEEPQEMFDHEQAIIYKGITSSLDPNSLE